VNVGVMFTMRIIVFIQVSCRVTSHMDHILTSQSSYTHTNGSYLVNTFCVQHSLLKGRRACCLFAEHLSLYREYTGRGHVYK
jgi:hypothetical protein